MRFNRFEKSLKVLGVVSGEDFYISRNRHDFVSFPGGFIDGGQSWGAYSECSYVRVGGKNRLCWAEVYGVNSADLSNDYSKGIDKYKPFKLSNIKILSGDEYPDLTSTDWKIETAIWGTYGKNGGQPLTYIRLIDAESSHLEAILSTQILNKCQKDLIHEILKRRRYSKCIKS